MNYLLLSDLYDSVTKTIGPTLAWVFLLLMGVELVYVMVKYLRSGDSKK